MFSQELPSFHKTSAFHGKWIFSNVKFWYVQKYPLTESKMYDEERALACSKGPENLHELSKDTMVHSPFRLHSLSQSHRELSTMY
jgi:hypothetical protein